MVTKLESPLRRLVEITPGNEIVVEIVPSDAGIPAHIKLRRKDEKKAYHSWYIDTPPRQNGGGAS
jgi:hypothetical protein